MGTTLRLFQRIAALVGLAASLYGVYVETESEAARQMGREYIAACDLGPNASCSKVFSSSYGHILSHWGVVPKGSALDFSSAALGAAFYAVTLVHEAIPLPVGGGCRSHTRVHNTVMLAAAVGSLCLTLYLAYVLKFILNDFCVVCATMYTSNIAIFITAALRILGPRTRKAGKSE